MQALCIRQPTSSKGGCRIQAARQMLDRRPWECFSVIVLFVLLKPSSARIESLFTCFFSPRLSRRMKRCSLNHRTVGAVNTPKLNTFGYCQAMFLKKGLCKPLISQEEMRFQGPANSDDRYLRIEANDREQIRLTMEQTQLCMVCGSGTMMFSH